MGKFAAIIGGIILTSFYFFPFEFVSFPGVNTKLIMAVISLVLVGVNLAKGRSGRIDKGFMVLCLYALLVSFTTLFAVFYNDTRDYTYITYVISMLVWTGGGYTAVSAIKWVHGKVSVQLVIYYLIAACVMQSLLAIGINNFPAVEVFCNSFCLGLSDTKNYVDEGRLYGIGCAFDVAGMRFAAVLIMMGFLLPRIIKRYNEQRPYIIILYLFAFVLISVTGNMIARTTTVGLIVALLYILYSLLHPFRINLESAPLWKWMVFFILASSVILMALYNFDANFRENFRFAFEGFFSLVEKGRWEVHSNDILVTMYRFPESFRTWIIGDGYFFNTNLDPYYTGVEYKEYYMATDVGYLRFIYYSGLIGLGAFALFMCKAASFCMKKYERYKVLFFLLLILQFLIWAKVASDIYSVFALFIAMYSVSKTEMSIDGDDE